jgi:hypothetical protein
MYSEILTTREMYNYVLLVFVVAGLTYIISRNLWIVLTMSALAVLLVPGRKPKYISPAGLAALDNLPAHMDYHAFPYKRKEEPGTFTGDAIVPNYLGKTDPNMDDTHGTVSARVRGDSYNFSLRYRPLPDGKTAAKEFWDGNFYW